MVRRRRAILWKDLRDRFEVGRLRKARVGDTTVVIDRVGQDLSRNEDVEGCAVLLLLLLLLHGDLLLLLPREDMEEEESLCGLQLA
jgi:hypothetical protein